MIRHLIQNWFNLSEDVIKLSITILKAHIFLFFAAFTIFLSDSRLDPRSYKKLPLTLLSNCN